MPQLLLFLTLILATCSKPPESSASAAVRIAEEIIGVIDQALEVDEDPVAGLEQLASTLSELTRSDIEVQGSFTALFDLFIGLSRGWSIDPPSCPPLINVVHQPKWYYISHDPRLRLTTVVSRGTNLGRGFLMLLAQEDLEWRLLAIPRPVGEQSILMSLVNALKRQAADLPSGYVKFSTKEARGNHIHDEAGHLRTTPAMGSILTALEYKDLLVEPGTFSMLTTPEATPGTEPEGEWVFQYECDYCGMAYRFRGIWQPDAWIFPTEPELIAGGAVPEGG